MTMTAKQVKEFYSQEGIDAMLDTVLQSESIKTKTSSFNKYRLFVYLNDTFIGDVMEFPKGFNGSVPSNLTNEPWNHIVTGETKQEVIRNLVKQFFIVKSDQDDIHKRSDLIQGLASVSKGLSRASAEEDAAVVEELMDEKWRLEEELFQIM